MELGHSRHESLELEDDVLDVLVVQQLQLDQHIRSESSKPLPSVGPAPEDQSVLVVSGFDPVERFTEDRVGGLLVVHFLDFEAVGEVLELDVGVPLDRQLCVRNGLVQVGAQVVEDLSSVQL